MKKWILFVAFAAVLGMSACSDDDRKVMIYGKSVDDINLDKTDPGQTDPNQGGLNQPDPNQTDPNQGDPNQPDPNQTDPNQPDPNQSDPNQPDPNQPDPTQPEPACQNACDGAPRCADASQRMICRDDNADGCTEWVYEPCPASQECEGGTCITPVPPCADTCDAAVRCSGSAALQKCLDTDNDGCKEWGAVETCPGGQVCESGACVTPKPTCTNQCPSNGATQCSGKVIQTCKDANADGCLEWTNSNTCSYKCESAKCIDDPNAWVPACSGSSCPTVVNDLSKVISGDTRNGTSNISSYSGKCSTTSEAGPEQAYIFKVPSPGYIFAGVTEPSSGDVDVHILTGMSAGSCLARDNRAASVYASAAGVYYVIVDTYSKASNAGAYNLKITFIPDSGQCGLKATSVPRYNGASTLSLPTSGKVVQEAHLVTTWDQAQNGGSKWWPSSITQWVTNHKAHTDELFGAGTSNGADWCPQENCEFGQGSTGAAVPPDAEAWYINMLWKSRPAKGTRFLVLNPFTGKAVVSAAGYETGPFDSEMLGGVVYEVHKYLGTSHRSILSVGEMKNQSLPFGPIDCSH